MKPELEGLVAKVAHQWCDLFRLLPAPDGRSLVVSSPFVHDDGDALPVFLDYDREAEHWVISDHGQAIGHLGYDDDYAVTPHRVELVRSMAENWGATASEDGEIMIALEHAPDAFVIADFLQLMSAIACLPLQVGTAERPQFGTRARNLILSWLPESVQTDLNWTDDELDPESHWPVDLRIWRSGSRLPVDSLFVATAEPMWRAGLTLTTYRDLGIRSEKVVVYQVSEKSDSRALYGLQETAERVGARAIGVRGEPTPTNMQSVRHALNEMDVPLLT